MQSSRKKENGLKLRWCIYSFAIVIFLCLLFFVRLVLRFLRICAVFHLRPAFRAVSMGGMTSWSHVLRGASLWKQHARYAPSNVVREWWGTVLPTEGRGGGCLFHLRQITISPGLDSNGLSLWNGILPHALQIYLLFYLPGQAHGKIIPNTCRALSGTLE